MVHEDTERSGLEMYGGLAKVLDEAVVEYGWDKKWMAEGKAEGITEGIAKGKAEGIAKGKAEGKAEGIAEGKDRGKKNTLAIVKGLLNNIALEQLAMETNTPIEEIEAIKLELLPV
jgi:flagellar biosynthesis/type III secretory pathway protein FliH